MRLSRKWDLLSSWIEAARAGAGVSGDYASFMVVDSSGRIVLASHDSGALEGQFLTDLAVSGTLAVWSESVNGAHCADYIDAVAHVISENPGESNAVIAGCGEDGRGSILAFGRIRDLSGNAIAYMSVSTALAPVLQAANKRALAEIDDSRTRKSNEHVIELSG